MRADGSAAESECTGGPAPETFVGNAARENTFLIRSVATVPIQSGRDCVPSTRTTLDRQRRSTSLWFVGVEPPVLIMTNSSDSPLFNRGRTGSEAGLACGESHSSAVRNVQGTGVVQP
jgi:hypothetical protein